MIIKLSIITGIALSPPVHEMYIVCENVYVAVFMFILLFRQIHIVILPIFFGTIYWNWHNPTNAQWKLSNPEGYD